MASAPAVLSSASCLVDREPRVTISLSSGATASLQRSARAGSSRLHVACKSRMNSAKGAAKGAKESRGAKVKAKASTSGVETLEKKTKEGAAGENGEKEAQEELTKDTDEGVKEIAAKETKGAKEKKGAKEPKGAKEVKGAKESKKVKERKIRFSKYQGLGNDFIMIDNRKQSEPLVTPEEAMAVCNRNFGIGGDGVIFLLPEKKGYQAQYAMRIYNSDGSEPEMCGNGIRCLAKFIADVEGHKDKQSYVVSTLAGDMVLNLREDGQVQVDMGEPILEAAKVPTTLAPTNSKGAVVQSPLDIDGDTWRVTCVSMGNPHCITFSSDKHPDGLDVQSLDLHRLGPMFETNAAFPAKINTEFVQVISRTELRMRVWERGAGPTLACGTGACALVVAAVLEGRAERNCLVHLPGGPLEIQWRAEDNRIYMTGPAQEVFSGKLVL